MKFPILFVLRGLFPLFFTLVPMYAQPFTCSATAPVIPIVSPQGTSATVGNVFLDCSGGNPVANGAPVPVDNFALYFNASILGSSGPLLSIDSPGGLSNPNVLVCSDPLNGCPMDGAPPGQEPYDGSSGRANEFQGVIGGTGCGGSFYCVVFYGVPIDPPGSSGQLLLEFGDISVDPSTFFPFPGFAPDSIMEAVSVSGSAALPVNNSFLPVATVSPEASTFWLAGIVLIGAAFVLNPKLGRSSAG